MILVASAAGAQTRIKIATMAPDGSFWMNELQAAADLIDQRTDGRVSLRFYPGGTMGSDSAVLRKIRIGQLQGGVFWPVVWRKSIRDFDVYNLPLLFWSFDEVDYVRQRMDASLIDELAKSGLVAFGITETGFTYLMSAKPTRTFADLRGRKAWASAGRPDQPRDRQCGRAVAGAAADFGRADRAPDRADRHGGGAPGRRHRTAVVHQGPLYHRPADHLRVRRPRHLGQDPRKAEPGDRKIVSEVLAAASGSMDRKTRADDQEARAALVKQGATFVDPTDETRAEWIEIAARATKKLLAERDYDPKIVAEIQRLLAEYRASHPDGE